MAATEYLVDRIQKANAGRTAPCAAKVIVICTPTLGTITMQWATAVADLAWPMNIGRARMPGLDPDGGNIAEVRNRLVVLCQSLEKANKVEVDSIMWVDDDVIIHQMCMCQLRQHDRDIVSGVYFAKSEVSEPLIFAGHGAGTLPFRPGETFEAWGWAQGLSLIKMDVYRRMEKELDLGKDKWGNPAWYETPKFGFDEAGGLVTGGTEDFKFFGNAHKLEYVPLVDCTKLAFGWHYDLSAKHAYPRKQWEQYMRMQPITWETKDGVIVWD